MDDEVYDITIPGNYLESPDYALRCLISQVDFTTIPERKMIPPV